MQQKMHIMLFIMVINTFLTLSKILVGVLFNSQLLLTDGLHSASDMLTDLFSIIGLRSSKRPKDEVHPFGHGNLEYAAGLTVSMLIFFVIFELARNLILQWNVISDSIDNIVIVVAIITFIIKYFLSIYVLKKAKALDSHTLRNSGMESKADALSTIIVIAGLLLTIIGIKYNISWLIYSEKIATAFVIIMLLKVAYTIYSNSITGIAGATAETEIQEKYLNLIKKYDSTLDISTVLVLKQGIYYAVSVILCFDAEIDIKEVYKKILNLKTRLLSQDSISQVNIEFKVNDENN